MQCRNKVDQARRPLWVPGCNILICAIGFALLPRPAFAHGNGLVLIVALGCAPLHLLIFTPVAFLSGIRGRRRWIFLAYFVALVILYALQVQKWYHPIARAFNSNWPFPLPSLDILTFSVLVLIAAYFVARRWSVPIRFELPLPIRNLLLGASFSVLALIIWWVPLFLPEVNGPIRSWPDGLNMLFSIVWILPFPIGAICIACMLFDKGRIAFWRSADVEGD